MKTISEANGIVISHRLHLSNPLSDVVKGFYYSTKISFEELISWPTAKLVDRACAWYWTKNTKTSNDLSVKIFNHYLYGRLFCHNHRNMF